MTRLLYGINVIYFVFITVASSCELPANPQHGSFTILNCDADDNTPLCQKVVGTMAPDNTILDFHCNSGYRLTGKSASLCLNGKWTSSLPTCDSVSLIVEEICEIPDKPEHGSFAVLNCETGDNSPLCQKVVGTVAPDNTVLIFQCDPGYVLTGRLSNTCINKVWYNLHPTCERVKPTCKLPEKPMHGNFDILNCQAGDNSPLCQKVVGTVVPELTILKFQCDDSYSLTGSPTNPCFNGLWLTPHATCEISISTVSHTDCGTRNRNGKPLVATHEEAQVGEFPWHVGIYRNRISHDSEGVMEQICGGTLVNPDTVITAAHCIWNDNARKPYNTSMFRVAAGKHFRDWYRIEAVAQKRELSDIIPQENYRGHAGLFYNDIAILKLKEPVLLSRAILPVCLDYANDYERIQLVNGNPGTIVGWGITEKNVPSDVLITKQQPFVDFKTCFNAVPESFQQYLSRDKFCAGYANGTSVCPGDAGGGLVFEHQERYYLRGISSIGIQPRLENDEFCAHTYSGFTRVSDFLEWMKPHL